MAALTKGRPSHPVLGSQPVLMDARRTRASDVVFDDLAEKIRKLELAPGQSISESEFASFYGVSRTPVRAAIAALADSGMVYVTPQVGTRVAYIDFAEVEQAQFIRESLEINAIRYACEVPHRDFTAITEILDKQRALLDDNDPETFFLSDEAFHRETFVLAGFGATWSVVGRTRFQLDRIRRLDMARATPLRLRKLFAEHEQLLQYLRDRDEESAVNHLKRHIRRYINASAELQLASPDYFRGTPPTPHP